MFKKKPFVAGSFARPCSRLGGRRSPRLALSTRCDFSTLILTPLAIEGLTGDDYEISIPLVAAPLPGLADFPRESFVSDGRPGACACSPSNRLRRQGDLFVADNDKVWTFTPTRPHRPPRRLCDPVCRTNGLANDRGGASGPATATGQGRVENPAWRRPGRRDVPRPADGERSICGAPNVGRDVRSLPPGTITVTPTTRNDQHLGSQPLVANSVAFIRRRLLVADTARGAIWKVEIGRDRVSAKRLRHDFHREYLVPG